MNSYRTACLFRKVIVPRKALNIAVEDQTYYLCISIDDRASGISTYNIGGADEVERRVEIDRVLARQVTLGQIVRRFVVKTGCPVIESIEGGLVRNSGSVLFITDHRSIAQPEREGRV